MTDYNKRAVMSLQNKKGYIPKMILKDASSTEFELPKLPELPKPKRRKDDHLTIRISKELKQEYEEILEQEHATMTAHLTSEIVKYIKQNKKKPSV